MRNANLLPILPQQLEPLFFEYIETIEIPLLASCISAGFPSPADDYLEENINIGRYLIQNPASTYMMRVKGNSMVEANIHEGDILIIDRAQDAADGLPVICILEGEFTVKTFKRIKDKAFLVPANPAYKSIEVTEEMDMRVWGVVVWILHKPVKL
ncbi:LexA family protein [Pontibacter russatus]|uniref:LexA family protein n=1 Tax=Pontibacter russatus TaxID=2694929 RepID=UPI00137A5C9D|nr:translesion error-prone DNA polymerase V autoproteolytic subunit [Pontibacter russatus]